jgi:hypothetical protein
LHEFTFLAVSTFESADVDLAGDGGGDQGGAAFEEEGDGAVGLGGEARHSIQIPKQIGDDRFLLIKWRDGKIKEFDVATIQVRMKSTSLDRYTLSPAEAEFDGLTARSETIQLCL